MVRDLRHILDRTRVLYRTVGDLTYSVIREAIVTGSFSPGMRLRQDELAEAIGVSRMPIRSALMQLDSEGLVDFQAHRGAVVRSLRPEQVREIYELRSLLETYALRKAMRRMTPERAAELKALAARLDAAHEGPHFLEARVAFYHELYGGSEQPLLIDHIDRLRNYVGRYMLGRRVVGALDHGHGKLLEYIEQGNEDAAVAWLQMHLADVCNELIARLEKQ